MNIKKRRLVNIVAVEAVMLDWKEAFGGSAYGNQHLFRVNKIAKYLLDKEGGDVFKTLISAWCHDVSLVVGRDDDVKRVRSYTEKFLSQFDELSNLEKNDVLECVISHEEGSDRMSQEAKIVHDADVVDKSGMLGVVRHIWKMSNMLEDRLLKSSEDLNKLRNHLQTREKRLFTETAEELAFELNKAWKSFFTDEEFALRLMREISALSRKGEISDVIGERLIEQYAGHKVIGDLKSQLACTYLED